MSVLRFTSARVSNTLSIYLRHLVYYSLNYTIIKDLLVVSHTPPYRFPNAFFLISIGWFLRQINNHSFLLSRYTRKELESLFIWNKKKYIMIIQVFKSVMWRNIHWWVIWVILCGGTSTSLLVSNSLKRLRSIGWDNNGLT
jgi:hypothetical protein